MPRAPAGTECQRVGDEEPADTGRPQAGASDGDEGPASDEGGATTYAERLQAAARRVPKSREVAAAAAKWLWTECCASTDLDRLDEYIELLRAVDSSGVPLLTFTEKLAIYDTTPEAACDSFEAYMWLSRRETAIHAAILQSLTAEERQRDFTAIYESLDRGVLEGCDIGDPAFREALAEEARLQASGEEPCPSDEETAASAESDASGASPRETPCPSDEEAATSDESDASGASPRETPPPWRLSPTPRRSPPGSGPSSPAK